jgi:hypothetical protein
MEEALRIHEFLPVSYANKSEEDYIKFLWEAFESNYNHEKYEFANIAFHLLYMSFACFSVWQIRVARKDDFNKAMVGFQNDIENKLANADTPFKFFEHLKEATIFRFIKLIGCTNEQIGEFSKFIKQRNRIAHPSGTVFFNNKEKINEHIIQIISEIENIQSNMICINQDCLREFLVENWNPEDWEYSIPEDQISYALIHANYFSQKDIEACIAFDIDSLNAHKNFIQLKELFDVFVKIYKKE